MKGSTTRIAVLFACWCALVSCADSTPPTEGQNNSTNSIKSAIATRVPVDIRSLDSAGLSVSITLNDKTFTAKGSDHPSGAWMIPIEITANRQHTVKVSWFHGEHLLMEEYATVYANANKPQIVFEPSYFITSGYPRLDDDCDGISNYIEILAGEEAGPTKEEPGTECTNITRVAEDNATILFATNFWVYDDIENLPVNRLEQRFNITQSNDTVNNVIQLKLVGEEELDGIPKHNLQLLLTDNPESPRALLFSSRNGLSGQPADDLDGRCRTQDTIQILCQITMDWKENQWYQLTFAEISPGLWQAWISEEGSEERIIIGSIETETNIAWSHVVSGFYYAGPRLPRDCSPELPLISMQLSDVRLNDFFTLPANKTFQGTCLQHGSGWSEGKRVIGDETVYSLTIGEP